MSDNNNLSECLNRSQIYAVLNNALSAGVLDGIAYRIMNSSAPAADVDKETFYALQKQLRSNYDVHSSPSGQTYIPAGVCGYKDSVVHQTFDNFFVHEEHYKDLLETRDGIMEMIDSDEIGVWTGAMMCYTAACHSLRLGQKVQTGLFDGKSGRVELFD